MSVITYLSLKKSTHYCVRVCACMHACTLSCALAHATVLVKGVGPMGRQLGSR